MIEPSQIISLLQNIPLGAPIEHYITSRVYAELPKCKQRAIATLQCAMLEPAYKPLVEAFKAQNYDLHQKMQEMVKQVYARKN